MTNTFYYNRNPAHKDIKDALQSPHLRVTRDYHNSQKHVSEKFQQFLQIEKLKSDEGHSSKLNYQNNGNPFNGRIEGNSLKRRHLPGEDHWQSRYLSEWNDGNKQTYTNESD